MKINHALLADPTIYQINRLEGVSSHTFHADRTEMEQHNSSFVHSLNGTWKFHYARNLEEAAEEAIDPSFDVSSWDDIQVPGHIQLQGYGTPMYVNQIYPWSGTEQVLPGDIPQNNPVGTYVTEFTYSPDDASSLTRIVFHGAESAIAVYVNGIFIGYSEDSYTPSMFDITSALKGGINRLTVFVYRFSSGSWLEDQDYWRFSGICRDVQLQTLPSVHINSMKITTDLYDHYTKADVHVQLDVLSSLSDVQITACIEDHGSCIASADGTDVTFHLDDPHLWSSEDPYLYDLIITASHLGNPVETAHSRFGIREFRIEDGIMKINGKRIVFHGVNRHEFCAESGRVVSQEMTRNDLQIMKDNNINAVRTSHYPNSVFLYDLCDEMGLYVIDETNLETHGTWSELFDRDHILPNDFPQWHDTVLDRGRSMVIRDFNHPSIIMWSCGNESWGGRNIYDLSCMFHDMDPTRPVHYEGIQWDMRYPDTSDVVSTMYTPAKEIEAFLKEHDEKPYMLCEYAHAMGNSCGALKDYTDLAEKYPHYQGGFIWDFVDQALWKDGKLCYGGDFRERPSDYDFCGNGLLFADRSITPKMQEVRYCYQYVLISINEKQISITNRYLFTDLNQFHFVVEKSEEGKTVDSVSLTIHCQPDETVVIDNPYNDINTDVHTAITLRMFRDGKEYAHQQYLYPYTGKTAVPTGSIRVYEDFLNVGFHCENTDIIFSKQKGLVSWCVNGNQLVRVPLRPNFYRAPVNNDVENGHGFRYGQWLVNSLYAKMIYRGHTVDLSSATIIFDCSLPSISDVYVTIQYEIYADGSMRVDVRVPSIPDQIEMPCFGVLWRTYPELDHVDYIGLGPDENMYDRHEGALYGSYSYTVADNLTPYLYPQECGTRTGVTQFTVSSQSHGMTFTSDQMEFSVLPYTPYELEQAAHIHELPVPYQTVIMINSRQMGVGGDNTWGARTHEEYLLTRQAHHLSFTVKAW